MAVGKSSRLPFSASRANGRSVDVKGRSVDVKEHLEHEHRINRLSLAGRYHRAPHKLHDEYVVFDKILGEGYNGTVHLATRKSNPQQRYAVKALKLSNIADAKLQQLQSEVANFLCMDHPHITRLHDVYESREHLHLVMECMEGGELFHRVSKLGRLPEQDASEAVWQMLLALNYIHSHGIVHRDIKLENFLFDKKNSNHLKLIDFGFSKLWDTRQSMDNCMGTVAYMAPEVLQQSYTSQCDMWSLGVITFILLSGYMPFSGPQPELSKKILAGKYIMKSIKWNRISEDAVYFTRKLLEMDPDKRLTAPRALNHPWIAKQQMARRNSIDVGIAQALHDFAALPRFRRCCLEMIAWNLSNDERAQVEEDFISLDKSGEGSIKLADLLVGMKKLDVSEDHVKGVFAHLDFSHDEEIHYSDFLAAMASTKISLNEQIISDAFKRFDADGSGYITSEDLLEVLGESFEGQGMADLLREASRGKGDRLSYPEFAAYIRGTEPPAVKASSSLTLKGALRGIYSTLLCMGPSPHA